MDDQNGFGDWGGYMDAKITKLEEQYSATSAIFRKSTLFSGISIYVNGLTNPSADELKRIMMVHGGTFHHYERSHTSFIIASNLPDVKVRNSNTSKIISPKWIVDCVAQNRILDYSSYLLYTNKNSTQQCLNFNKTKKESTSSTSFHPISSKVEKFDKIKAEAKILKAKISAEPPIPKKAEPTNKTTVKGKPAMTSGIQTARTAVDPSFLSEFYNKSRLHHIATLGADMKQYVCELRENHDEYKGFPARSQIVWQSDAANYRTQSSNSKYIMHIDMDCFFVSVGLRKHPHLRGKPVAVTHSKGGSSAHDVPINPDADRKVEADLFVKRFDQQAHNTVTANKVLNGFDGKMSLSEIASCSYEARQKGVRNGMFVGQALKLCPDLNTIPYDFEGYKAVAKTLYDTIAEYTLQIEAVSCDEMFVDLTDLIKDLQGSPMEFVSFIRDKVYERTGCTCSAGIGANKLQARIATKKAKPNGQFFLETKDVKSYMSDILAEELPGVGSSTSYILKRAGYTTCGDLQRLTLAELQRHVGKKHGETLYQFCRGIDNRQLVFEQVRKSVSAEVNYGIRFKEHSELETFLRQLCTEVHGRLSRIKRKAKCVTLKLMVRAKEAPMETSKFMGHGVCDNITKSVLLSDFTDDVALITNSVITTMNCLKLPPNELRGIGIQLTKLDEPKLINEPKDNTLKSMFSNLSEIRKKEKNENCATTNEQLNSFKAATHEHVSNVVLNEQPSTSRAALEYSSSSSLIQKNKFKEKPNPIENNIPPHAHYPAAAAAASATTTKKPPDLAPNQTNFFLQPNCRELLLAWVKNDPTPRECDISLCCEHAREMVRAHQICPLYNQILYFRKIIESKRSLLRNSPWYNAYRAILESIQSEITL